MKKCALLCLACALTGAERSRVYIAPAVPTDAAAFTQVPAPAVRFQANEAQATSSPWVDSNAWRFQRGVQKVNYSKLPAGAAPLAAAEAFAFGADAILNPDPADLPALEKMLAFLKEQEQPALPVMANIGVVDDGSPAMGEVLNLLTRRNLLYRVVAKPDPKLAVTVQPGDLAAAANPSLFAAHVRGKLGDDKRLVRLYGTTTTIAHLTGDGHRARLVLLTYGRSRNQQSVRISLLGRYQPTKLAAYGAPGAQLEDPRTLPSTTEFTVPAFNTIAILDLH